MLWQVENEYGNVEEAYGIGGQLYVQWAAETAVNMNTSVPWVMCSQRDAPDPVVSIHFVTWLFTSYSLQMLSGSEQL